MLVFCSFIPAIVNTALIILVRDVSDVLKAIKRRVLFQSLISKDNIIDCAKYCKSFEIYVVRFKVPWIDSFIKTLCKIDTSVNYYFYRADSY